MKEFARDGNRILFVNPGINLLELFCYIFFPKLFLHIEGSLKTSDCLKNRGLKKVRENIWSLTYLYLPRFSFLRIAALSNTIDKINSVFLYLNLRRKMNRLDFRKPVIWNSFAIFWGVQIMDKLGAKVIVYHCTDEFGNPPGSKQWQQLKKWEEKMLEIAGVVFTVSPMLYESRKRLNPNAYFIPNGVSSELCVRIENAQCQIPEDSEKITKPHIGYIGAIQDKLLDFSLIEDLANSRPNWSIVLIGPVSNSVSGEVERLKQLHNVHFLGPKEGRCLPGYLAYFDVGIIPFAQNDLIKNAFPLKFFEYLAAGLPVVTTEIPSLLSYKDYAIVARDHEEFIAGLSKALMDNDIALKQKRIEFARNNTWEQRVAEYSKIIEQYVNDNP